MPDLPTGTVTFLFTDIEGSTRLLERLGSEYEGVLSHHRRLIRAAVAAHDGIEVDTQGDAFLCVFQRAADAVAAAADAQRSLAETDVRVRMGIHTGEPTPTEEGYVGVDLHRGARVMAAAHGGQVLLSGVTHDLLSDVSVQDLGEHRLKDLSQPQRLYQLVGDGLQADFPPLRTLENRPTNLPTQPTQLVGRQRELSDVLELLARDDVRLVTLTGPGGTGKTRLALQVAAELVEAYPNGAFFVNLAVLTDDDLVIPTIAQTLGLKEQPTQPIASTLVDRLREQKMLLVLDNFEQVTGAAAAVGELLAQAPELNLLVTSRSSLHLQAEREYAVPPLGDDEALALFVERAQAAKASFSLDGNRPVVVEICRRLDQLPLAIELAAARVKLLPEQALLDRLDDKLKLLTGGARDLDERQRTLRAAIDWSYELLSEEEQVLFQRLAVFAGGRTFEAIEAICNPDGDLDAFGGIESLVDKSLLRQEETEGDEPRFVMLETIQEYAHEKLEASGEAEELHGRHADYFLSVAKENRVDPGGDPSALGVLQRERDNIRAALDTFRATKRAEAELDLAASLASFWYATGPASEGCDVLASALGRSTDAPDELRLRALSGLSGLAYFCGRYDEALQASQAALDIARERGDAAEIMAALGNVALDYLSRGDVERAMPLFEEAVALSDEPIQTAQAKANLGYAKLVAGDIDGAADFLEDAANITREVGAAHAEAHALLNLGLVRLRQEDLDGARASFRWSLESADRAGVPSGVAMGLLGVAAVAAREGDAERAATLLGAADAMLEKIEVSLEPYETRVRQEVLAVVEESLGAEATRDALEAAKDLSVDEVVERALEREQERPAAS